MNFAYAAKSNRKQEFQTKASLLSYPAVMWAGLGFLVLTLQAYVLVHWVSGPQFVATPPGSDPLPDGQRLYYILLQVLVPAAALLLLWLTVIKPWRREGHLTTDGMLAIACSMVFFWDQSMNYTATQLLYNSHFINRGSWGSTESFPGWTSPNGQLLPEPIFITIPGYAALVYSQVLFVLWILRIAKRRWHGLSPIAIIGLIVAGLTVVDSVIEASLLRMGIYAYPGGIRSVTLFAGETYQFPLTEGFFFGGLGIGAIAVLSFFRNDKGETLAERGIHRLSLGTTGRQGLKFMAIYGFVHISFVVLYTVPNQWLGTHTDPFPQGYPSYLINNMCVNGAERNQCPGPGVLMPRP